MLQHKQNMSIYLFFLKKYLPERSIITLNFSGGGDSTFTWPAVQG
jgi:PP-loop superfamily ATP-utilizing enzyme